MIRECGTHYASCFVAGFGSLLSSVSEFLFSRRNRQRPAYLGLDVRFFPPERTRTACANWQMPKDAAEPLHHRTCDIPMSRAGDEGWRNRIPNQAVPRAVFA